LLRDMTGIHRHEEKESEEEPAMPTLA